jgi:hypothetical protein
MQFFMMDSLRLGYGANLMAAAAALVTAADTSDAAMAAAAIGAEALTPVSVK